MPPIDATRPRVTLTHLDDATRLDLLVEFYYPHITGEGVEALSSTEWELLASLAQVDETPDQATRDRLATWARRRTANAAQDPFATFPRDAA